MEKVNEANAKGIEHYDWDNLVILDGCRLDTFKSTIGECRSRVALAGCTPEYIWENFSDGDYDDVVYVTGNPQLSPESFRNKTGRRIGDVFHEVFHTYRYGWDDDTGTTRPEPVLEDLETANKLFPEKRKVAHFMQPHIPFLDSDVRSPYDSGSRNVWRMAEMGIYGHNEVKRAYSDNLRYVWDRISDSLSELDGRTLVTSDHGNFLGENGRYDHTDYSRAKR
jgi:hypothetical protein|nr:MAG: hypothetical protein J07AB56_00400 [Candidatus Nanosalinarum sp. J07AB56]